VIEIKPDYSTLNLEVFTNHSIVDTIDEKEKSWKGDILRYMNNYFGEEMIIDNINEKT
jgi:hypothetical protein